MLECRAIRVQAQFSGDISWLPIRIQDFWKEYPLQRHQGLCGGITCVTSISPTIHSPTISIFGRWPGSRHVDQDIYSLVMQFGLYIVTVAILWWVILDSYIHSLGGEKRIIDHFPLNICLAKVRVLFTLHSLCWIIPKLLPTTGTIALTPPHCIGQ